MVRDVPFRHAVANPNRRYALTLPVSTVIIGCDSIAQLEENVTIAKEFTPMSATQMAALEARAEPVHKEALFFRRWDA